MTRSDRPLGRRDARPAVPLLHVVTDDAVLGEPDFEDRAVRVLEAGAHLRVNGGLALHLRGPATSGARLESLARALLPAARGAGVTFVVNDRVDLALAVESDGVHLGRRSLPARLTRNLLGPESLIGLSVHGPGEAAPEERDGADYLMVGTIFPSASHPERDAGGAGLLADVGGAAPSMFLVAIGGITSERVAEVIDAGASGVAALGAVWHRDDPGAATEELMAALMERVVEEDPDVGPAAGSER